MFVDLANTELRAQADPYIRGNPIRRLAWNIFERGAKPQIVGQRSDIGGPGHRKRKWEGKSDILARVYQTVDAKTGQKAERSNILGRVLPPESYTQKEISNKSIHIKPSLLGLEKGGVSPDPKKVNVQFSTGGDSPHKQDVAVLGHELGHLGSWYVEQQKKITPYKRKLFGFGLFDTNRYMDEATTKYGDVLTRNKLTTDKKSMLSMKHYKYLHTPHKIVGKRHKEISAAATELLIDRGVPPERQYKRTTPGYFKLPFTGS